MRKIVRDRILKKYNNKCVRCESTQNLEVDHIMPLTRGGRHNEDNFQILCRSCNRKKSNNIDYEYLKQTYFIINKDKEYILIRRDFPIMSFPPNECRAIFDRVFEDHAEFWNLKED